MPNIVECHTAKEAHSAIAKGHTPHILTGGFSITLKRGSPTLVLSTSDLTIECWGNSTPRIECRNVAPTIACWDEAFPQITYSGSAFPRIQEYDNSTYSLAFTGG